MKGGFSFCGVDIGTIGLEYAPELEDTYVYKSAKARIHEQTWDGHDGGYYYGSSKEPKEFILRCIFEEKQIDYGLMAKVGNLFREGKSGKIVFDRRPWCYYFATVTDLDLTGITNYLNGVIKITMKAYYPYGRSDLFTIKQEDRDYRRMLANTAFLNSEEQMPPTIYCIDGPIEEAVTEDDPILLYNPGTELAQVGIEIAGDVGEGVAITNLTTGQTCKFVAMSADEFDGDSCYVYLDGINGKTVVVENNVARQGFLYHDEGFIQLEPAFPIERDVRVSTRESRVYTLSKLYDRLMGEEREQAVDTFVGQFIWLENKWREIVSVGREIDAETVDEWRKNRYENEHELILKEQVSNGIKAVTTIARMNKILVTPLSTMKLTRLRFIYKPTFS